MWVCTCMKIPSSAYLCNFMCCFWSHAIDFTLHEMVDKWHKNATHHSLSQMYKCHTLEHMSRQHTHTQCSRRSSRRWADVASRRNSSDWRTMDTFSFFYFPLSSTSGDSQTFFHNPTLLIYLPLLLLDWQCDDISMGPEYKRNNDLSAKDTNMLCRSVREKYCKLDNSQDVAYIRWCW